jgi:hypothetical protein
MANQYKIQNYINGKPELFNSEEEANVRIKELEDELLALNVTRFSVLLSIKSASGVLVIAPSDNSQEDADYMVFNHHIGQYEDIKGRTAAYARNQELKDEFLAELAQVPELYIAPVQPTTTGTQEL